MYQLYVSVSLSLTHRAIRNLIERHLLVHATTLAQCLEQHSIRTEHKGWFYGSTVRDEVVYKHASW